MLGERAGHTPQATALVNEAYLRLIHTQGMNWQNRAQYWRHYFAIGERGRQFQQVVVNSGRSRPPSGASFGPGQPQALGRALPVITSHPGRLTKQIGGAIVALVRKLGAVYLRRWLARRPDLLQTARSRWHRHPKATPVNIAAHVPHLLNPNPLQPRDDFLADLFGRPLSISSNRFLASSRS